MSFLQGVETGSNLFSRSVANAATTQNAVFEAMQQPLRMQEEQLKVDRMVADNAMQGIRNNAEKDALSDNVVMAEAMQRLNKGEDVTPNLKTAGAMQQWSQIKSNSLLGKKVSSAVSTFNAAVASLSDADTATIMAMPSLPNGMPSPEQYRALQAAREAELTRKKNDAMAVVNANNQNRIKIEQMRLDAANAKAAGKVSSTATPEQKGADELYKSRLKAIDKTDMTLEEKDNAKRKLYTETYGAGPAAPDSAKSVHAVFDAKTGQYIKSDGSVLKNGKAVMSNEPKAPVHHALPQSQKDQPKVQQDPISPKTTSQSKVNAKIESQPQAEQYGPDDSALKKINSFISSQNESYRPQIAANAELALSEEIGKALGIQPDQIGGSAFGHSAASQVNKKPGVKDFFNSLPASFKNSIYEKVLKRIKSDRGYYKKMDLPEHIGSSSEPLKPN